MQLCTQELWKNPYWDTLTLDLLALVVGKVTGNSQFRGSSMALNKKGDPNSQYCFSFNRNSISSCEMPDNKCRNRRQHQCMTCQQWGCKQVNHPPAGQVVNNSHVPSKYHSGTTHRPILQAHVLS